MGIVIIGSLLTNLIFPVILLSVHPDMHYIIGNPKSLYLYDISSACNSQQNNDIQSALDHLSDNTGIKFVQIPSPLALVSGGIEYTCGDVQSYGASGESEGGSLFFAYIIVSWNQIRLRNTGSHVVIHETLHSMGFDHNQDPNSIMYPIGSGDAQIDPGIIEFLKTYYINNPFAYMNILTLNMFFVILFLLFIYAYFGQK